jgi:hypothetical protein
MIPSNRKLGVVGLQILYGQPHGSSGCRRDSNQPLYHLLVTIQTPLNKLGIKPDNTVSDGRQLCIGRILGGDVFNCRYAEIILSMG